MSIGTVVGLVDTLVRKKELALGSMPSGYFEPNGANYSVSTDANRCNKHSEVKELEVPKTCLGYPNIDNLFEHHPIPI